MCNFLGSTVSSACAAKYAVSESAAQIAIPNAKPVGDQTFRKGEAIVDVPLLWRQAIQLGSEVRLMVDGKEEVLPARTTLPLHIVADENTPDRTSVVFCTPRKASENKTEKGVLGALLGGGSLWRDLVRSASDRQLCLMDTDVDGSLDNWVLIGDGSAAARTPNPIPALNYAVITNVPISDKDRYRVFFNGASGSGKWAEFRLEVLQQGESRNFDSMSTSNGSYGRIERRPRPESGWPFATNVAGAEVVITSIEKKGTVLSVKWPTVSNPELQVQIPEEYRVTLRYY